MKEEEDKFCSEEYQSRENDDEIDDMLDSDVEEDLSPISGNKNISSAEVKRNEQI